MTKPLTSDATPAVAFEGASVGYGRTAVLTDVTFRVETGQFFAIVGPNGSGKTTLLRTLLGVIPPLSGRVVPNGRMGYAPQRQALDDLFPFTSREVVAHGLINERSLDSNAAAARLEDVLDRCGVAERSEYAFRDLSGGQKQRVLIARALVTRPDTLVLDEPTNDLDVRGEHDVMKLVEELHHRGTTVIMVSHQLHVVARFAGHIAFINDGALLAGDRDTMLTPQRLESLYGVSINLGTGRPNVDRPAS